MPIGLGAGLLIGGLASAGGAVGAAAIGSHAAGKAADQQKAAADQSYQLAQEQAARIEPFRQAGLSALPGLQEGVAEGGNLVAPFTEQFKPPTVTDDPGYQFRLSEGQKALERSAAAKGGLLTGGTIKATERYAQDLASQEYQNAFARAMAQYGLGRENFYTNQANAYNRQMGVADLGLGAIAGQNNMVNAQNAATTQGAAAQAAGTVGSGNAWAGGLQGATGALGNYLLLSSILGGGNNGNWVQNPGYIYPGGPLAG